MILILKVTSQKLPKFLSGVRRVLNSCVDGVNCMPCVVSPYNHINTLQPSDTMLWHLLFLSSLVQVIACRLFGIKPLPEPMMTYCYSVAWWRHQMETFSALLALCAGHSPVPGEFPTQRPVTRSFDVYFDLRPNKRLGKQSWGWWFQTLSWSLWRHRNGLRTNFNEIWIKIS